MPARNYLDFTAAYFPQLNRLSLLCFVQTLRGLSGLERRFFFQEA